MAQPTAYDRQASFSNIQAQAPDDPLPGNTVDAELNAIKATLDAILTNIALIQRDDGALANESVGTDQLSTELSVGINTWDPWVTATVYAVDDTVFHTSAVYRCAIAHTAGTFATDLAAVKWTLILDLATLTLATAANIANTPAGSIAAVTVQAAIDELASEKAAASHTHPSTAITDSTAAGRSMLAAATAAAQRTLLGLGALALEDTIPVTDIDAQFAFTGDISPAALASNTNDWAPTGLAISTTIKCSASAAIDLTGMLACGDGDIKILHNTGSYPITLLANSASSASANRFVFSGPAMLLPNADIALQYDNTSTTKGWRKLASSHAAPAFQVQLTKSSANLLLSRFAGAHLFINGANEIVPAAGVTLAPPATTTTLYYIYAYMSSGTMTLEASATAHAIDATYGHMTKNGDVTRTLVGLAYTVSSAWVDTAASRLVRSYYNDPGIQSIGFFTANRSTSSTAFVELNSEIRTQFLAWGDELLSVFATGQVTGTFNQSSGTSVGLDGTTALETFSGATATTGNLTAPVACAATTTPTIGYHYATLLGLVAGGTSTWLGSASSGVRCALHAYLKR